MKYINYLLVFGLFCSSCFNNKESNCVKTVSDIISIDSTRLSSTNIETVMAKPDILEMPVIVYGNIRQVPDEIAFVSVKLSGAIKTIYKTTGFVKKNEVLLTIESFELLEIKKDYLLAKENYNFQKKEFSRQGELAIEQATSLKKMNIAEIAYKKSEIELMYRRQQLLQLEINPDNIQLSNLNPEITVCAPVTGNIINSTVHKGGSYSPKETLYTISKSKKQIAYFKIASSDLYNLKENDVVTIKKIDSNDILANVNGITIQNTSSGTIVEVEIDQKLGLKNTDVISAEIPTIKKVLKIPNTAFINQNTLVLQVVENKFRVVRAEILEQNNDYSLVSFDTLISRNPIVLAGKNKIVELAK